MRKFTYWIAVCKNYNPCYSPIGRTKTECADALGGRSNPEDYHPPEKREIPYKDMFDFFNWVTSEGAGRDCGFIPGTQSKYKD